MHCSSRVHTRLRGLWTVSKLSMLYKKGPVMNCGNYRGISIMNSLSKCYDYLLHNRLMAWYKPCREQAGAQPKRGCVEHIITLRLMIDLFMKKKKPLYVAFIDFSKAYDRVPRMYLLNLLRKLGCGKVMLYALASMYMVTKFVLGATLITAVLGVKQGSPSSCFLVIVFVVDFVRWVKDGSPLDSMLQWLHLLVLMDDTVIMATSREKLCQKLNILVEWCNRSGMVINEEKTEFMSFNCSDQDPIHLLTHAGVVTVSYCTQYTYLGSIFTSDGKLASSMSKHAVSRTNAMNKLIRFLDKNRNAPFDVKKDVVDACFNSSLLYGCEAWLGNYASSDVAKMYIKGIKSLLGVRSQTSNDVCLLESGYPAFDALVKSRQKSFIQNKIDERSNMTDDPLMFALTTTRQQNPKMKTYIETLLSCEDILTKDKSDRVARVQSSTRTKLITYSSINNASFEVHPIYKTGHETVDDYLRITFTRFRTSSHRLKIETGRWSRIERERRVCQCGGGVQTEEHVLLHCDLVRNIKRKYGHEIISFEAFMNERKSKSELVMLYEILKLLEI